MKNPKKKEEKKKKGSKLYSFLKDYIAKEIENNKENKDINSGNNNDEMVNEEEEEEEEEEENDEKEEKRIKKIISGDEKVIKMNLNSKLNDLLKMVKLNREVVKSDEEIKGIDGKYFYDSWVKSFEEVNIKTKKVYRENVDIDEKPSLANMGYYIKKLFENSEIDIFCLEPSKLDTKLKKID